MAKIRVMLACNLLDLGGTEKAIQIFAKYLDKSRFEVFACGRLRGGVRVGEIEKMGIPSNFILYRHCPDQLKFRPTAELAKLVVFN